MSDKILGKSWFEMTPEELDELHATTWRNPEAIKTLQEQREEMTQEELENSLSYQAAKAGIDYTISKKPMAIGGGNFTDVVEEMNRNKSYEDGAEFGYKFAIRKACQWLWGARLDNYAEHDEEFLDDFLKAMRQ